MTKKKVLIFIDWYLPGYKAGGPIQSVANLVEHLKDEFDFSIITRDTDYCEVTPYPSVISNEWNKLPNGISVYYISQNALTRSTIRNLIRKTNFDIVYLNGIYSLYFTLIPLLYLRKKHKVKVIVAARGMMAQSALNVKRAKKQFFLRAIKVLKLFDKVVFHATNEVEKKDIRNVLGDKFEIRTAANLPQKTLLLKLPTREKQAGELRMVNIARIAPEKNLLYALQVLKKVPVNVQFDFYGPIYDQKYWEECQKVMGELPSNVRATYKGSLDSDQVLATLSAYHVMFMPTLGENFGHVILQSLMSGCPVIISDQTPWKGLAEKRIGWDFPLSEEHSFVDSIKVINRFDQSAFNTLSNHAFQYSEKFINNPEILEQNRYLFA
ncbi:MAG: glycosyltransferase family 4 protein [Bacteroidetes bacterium]|nr:glycosyltransferase family 4 protein [Bacteroidota bacterium]